MSTVSDDYKLNEGDVPSLVTILTPVSYKWKEMAISLKLPNATTEQCKDSNNVVSLNNVLVEWTSGNGDKNITLGKLRKVLAGPIVAHRVLADKLISEFNEAKKSDEQTVTSKDDALNTTTAKVKAKAEASGVKRPQQGTAAASHEIDSPKAGGVNDTDAPEVTKILMTDAMKKRYLRKKEKLTEKGLQKLNRDIHSDQHLRLVAEKIRRWEQKADLLNLSRQDVSDLKDKYGHDPYNLRTQALFEWKNKALHTTYHCLLCICIAAEWTDSANVIIELLEKDDDDLLGTKNLQQKYENCLKNIPQEKHPKLEEEISDDDDSQLRQISSKLTKWEEKPDLLELQSTEVQDITSEYKNNPAMQKREALEVWRNRTSTPTYKRLLCICIAGNWKDAADEIVKVLTN